MLLLYKVIFRIIQPTRNHYLFSKVTWSNFILYINLVVVGDNNETLIKKPKIMGKDLSRCLKAITQYEQILDKVFCGIQNL